MSSCLRDYLRLPLLPDALSANLPLARRLRIPQSPPVEYILRILEEDSKEEEEKEEDVVLKKEKLVTSDFSQKKDGHLRRRLGVAECRELCEHLGGRMSEVDAVRRRFMELKWIPVRRLKWKSSTSSTLSSLSSRSSTSEDDKQVRLQQRDFSWI